MIIEFYCDPIVFAMTDYKGSADTLKAMGNESSGNTKNVISFNHWRRCVFSEIIRP